jgi:cell division septum initiation protein DivIVA
MNNREFEQPEFTASIRGYDRLQVDDYIARLRAIAIEAEERAREAESELEFSRHATIGPRVSEIFDLAVAESKELRERVTAEADGLRAQARRDAEEILERARDLAMEIEADTKRARDEAIAEVEAAREDATEDLAAIARHREHHLADLHRLQESLASAARLVESGSGPRVIEAAEATTRALPAA